MCLFVCLFVCLLLFVCLSFRSACLCNCLCICLSLLSSCPNFSPLSFFLRPCPSVSLSLCLSVPLSPSLPLFLCLSVFLFVCLSVCLFVCQLVVFTCEVSFSSHRRLGVKSVGKLRHDLSSVIKRCTVPKAGIVSVLYRTVPVHFHLVIEITYGKSIGDLVKFHRLCRKSVIFHNFP